MKSLVLRKRRRRQRLRRPSKLVRSYRPFLERSDAGDDDACELIGPGNDHGDSP
ncbi:MAG TPA: hypothetical protein VKE26_05735 [Xanthobacteraceae bacterium]|nr:hypothetical protein [Xanthobacteraceae bacterium]